MDPAPFISLIPNSVTSFLPVKPIHVFSDFRGICSSTHAIRLPSTPSVQGRVTNELFSASSPRHPQCSPPISLVSILMKSPFVGILLLWKIFSQCYRISYIPYNLVLPLLSTKTFPDFFFFLPFCALTCKSVLP